MTQLACNNVAQAFNGQNFSDVLVIDVNEYSNNGHDYVSVFFAHPEFRTDEDGKRGRTMKGQVLFNTEGKKQAGRYFVL